MQRYQRLLAASMLLILGCSSDPYRIAPVSGQITLNGQPLAGAGITFQPVAGANVNPGPGSAGVTDSEGRYTLRLTRIGSETPGAVVGKHKVRIMPFDEPGDPSDDRPKKRPKGSLKIPSRYNEPDSKLEFDVPSGGTTSADFKLTSP